MNERASRCNGGLRQNPVTSFRTNRTLDTAVQKYQTKGESSGRLARGHGKVGEARRSPGSRNRPALEDPNLWTIAPEMADGCALRARVS